MEIEIDYDEDKEVKFWFHLLSYMSDSVSHEVRHYLADFLESELECGEFEGYSHFRELLSTEKEVGRLLLNHFEDSKSEILNETSCFIEEILDYR